MTDDNPTASASQVGGDHYKTLKIQPAAFIHALESSQLPGRLIRLLN